MPKRGDIQKVLVIGSGPIIIGQGAEFDYAGTQACKALKEEKIKVVLVNSNPATIMTDENMADKVYIQPINLEALSYIIDKERPDGLLATLGGQTGLNMAIELQEAGILDKYNVKLLGTSLEAIKKAEDRESFKELMEEIDEPIPKSKIVSNTQDGITFSKEIGFPIIVRPAFTLGGTGGGIANNEKELKDIIHTGIMFSRINQVLLEQSVAGWKEIEYEVMRDSKDSCAIICNMENIDPVGIHTGDSIVVAPSQTLRDDEHEMLRASALKIIRALKIEGGCNIQYALNSSSGEYIVIEVNPRVSRSSALASKATGYPIAKVAAKIAVGYNLWEIDNEFTKDTRELFEPNLDYIVIKIPKWPFDKFDYANRTLGTQMKATGEVMAIDRNFESTLLKAVISLEGNTMSMRKDYLEELEDYDIEEMLYTVDDDRIFVIFEGLRRAISIDKINDITKIDKWFLQKFLNIVTVEQELMTKDLGFELLHKAEMLGFTDREIEILSGEKYELIDAIRRAHHLYPVYKKVDTCKNKFKVATPYYYSTYNRVDESVISKKEKIIVIGSGPIRIGQGIEFDYCSVHAAWAIQKYGYESIIVNNNPETVSTDFDTADKLYFEPLFIEDVYNVIRKEIPKGVIVQFGGQTSINLAEKLMNRGVQILGTSVSSIDVAEDRKRFDRLLQELQVKRPKGTAVTSMEEGIQAAKDIGYPVLVRPSYVIGGRAMQVVYDECQLIKYLGEAARATEDHPILIDEYVLGIEVEVDAICDGIDVLIPGIMEHIERTGVHSGDSFTVLPPQTISSKLVDKIVEYTKKVSRAMDVIGLVNIQFAIREDEIYIIEVNPRASRTVPIMSKVTGIPMIDLAIQVILGDKLKDLNWGTGLIEKGNTIAVKAPVFSFQKLLDVDSALTPEMKSTGEVLGVDRKYELALLKAFLGAGYPFNMKGKILFSIDDMGKEESLQYVRKFMDLGFSIIATDSSYHFFKEKGLGVEYIGKDQLEEIKEKLKKGEICAVVNTPTIGKDTERVGFKIRSTCQMLTIPCFTCFDTVNAYITALKAYMKEDSITYDTLEEYR